MTVDKYFGYAAELLKVNPPHPTDQPIVARMRRGSGIESAESHADFGKAALAVKRALERATTPDALKAMRVQDPNPGPRRERLADKHRHHGRVRELLSQAGRLSR